MTVGTGAPMCDTTERPDRSKTATRPSWRGLYARAGLMLAALLVVQIVVTKGPELIGLQCALVVGGFVAMGRWARLNRAELEHLEWCECASSRVTVRVIASHRRRYPAVDETSVPLEVEPVTTARVEEPATTALVDAGR